MNPVLTVGRDGRFGAAPGRMDPFGAGEGSESAGHADGRGLEPAPRAVAEPPSCSLVGRTLAEVERALILDTLDHCLGNRTQAAKVLGISIRTLRNKLNEYGAAGIPIPEAGQRRP
jgi:two-component system response regulator FlrC